MDLARVAGWEPLYYRHDLVEDRFPQLDLYCTDPAQHLLTAGWDLDDLARVAGWEPLYYRHDLLVEDRFPGLDLYFFTDTAQHITTTG